MPVSEQTFQAVALEDPEGQWELHCGRLREKPAMTHEHNYVVRRLDDVLKPQLDSRKFQVSRNEARLRISPEHYYIPDLCVIPLALLLPNRARRELEVYATPLPLVVEIWSPSTGTYDVDVKVREYQRRGDPDIWRIHPYERSLTANRRQPDGTYTESVHRNGKVQTSGSPTLTVDLDTLFD
jgi:Uma2 family endonuclease